MVRVLNGDYSLPSNAITMPTGADPPTLSALSMTSYNPYIRDDDHVMMMCLDTSGNPDLSYVWLVDDVMFETSVEPFLHFYLDVGLANTYKVYTCMAVNGTEITLER